MNKCEEFFNRPERCENCKYIGSIYDDDGMDDENVIVEYYCFYPHRWGACAAWYCCEHFEPKENENEVSETEI